MGYKLVTRDEALEPKRVMSVFRERVEKHKEEIAELEEREKLVEKEKPVRSHESTVVEYEAKAVRLQKSINPLTKSFFSCY